MSRYANIPHPLFNLPASSQQDRLIPALDPTLIEIDGRNLADLVDFIYHFAGQVNHYDENMDLSDWRAFFAESLPFLVARIYKWDVDGLEKNLAELSELVDNQPGAESLQSLVSFIFNELILPIAQWQRRLEEEESSFNLLVSNLIAGNLQDPLKDFVALVNGAANWYCTVKPDYTIFQQQDPWGIDLIDLFTVNDAFHNTPGGSGARIVVLKDQLLPLAERFLEALREIKRKAPAYMQESLVPLQEEYQKKHAPHLGLLFTFLTLFQRFQADLNQLSTRHLEFFYNKVLGIRTRPLVPDQAHLIFETQKHIEEKLLKEGRLFKNGKDAVGQDVIFKLDNDIVVDKAQVESLRTLYLNHNSGFVRCDTNEKKKETFVEGLYIAPDAGKADGVEKPFKEEGKSWSTLGRKYSKFFLPPPPQATRAEPHPHARLGLVLSSPVLLLNEGERKIEILLCLKYGELDCIEKPEIRFRTKTLEDGSQVSLYVITESAFQSAIEAGLSAGAKYILSGFLENTSSFPIPANFQTPDSTPIPGITDNDENIIHDTLVIPRDTDYILTESAFDDAVEAGLSEGAKYIFSGFLENTSPFPIPSNFQTPDSTPIPGITDNDKAIIQENFEYSGNTYLLTESAFENAVGAGLSVEAEYIFSGFLEDASSFPIPSDFLTPDDTIPIPGITNNDKDIIHDNLRIPEDAYYFLTKSTFEDAVEAGLSAGAKYIFAGFLENASSFLIPSNFQTPDSIPIPGITPGDQTIVADNFSLQSELADALGKEYYRIDEESIKKAEQDQLSQQGAAYLREQLNTCNPYALPVTFENDKGDPIPVGRLSTADREQIKTYFTKVQALKVAFSGQEEWLPVAAQDMRIYLESLDQNATESACEEGDYELRIEVDLRDDFPPITFYNQEALGEKLDTEFPTVRIELDPCISVRCDTLDCEPECDLERCTVGRGERVALYNYLRHMVICDSCIQVEVCGVRNLIVQNEENVQDVNSPIAPFGVRPKINSEFYIGSKEVFCKNWKQFRVNVVWKDKPADLAYHYNSSYTILESNNILETDFKFRPAVLDDKGWLYYDNGAPPLFQDLNLGSDNLCDQSWPDPAYDPPGYYYEFEHDDFPFPSDHDPGPLTPEPLQPLDVNTRKGFVKMQLKGLDFFHEIYPTELARAMIKLSGGIDPNDVEELFENIRTVEEIKNELQDKLTGASNSIKWHIDLLVPEIDNAGSPPGLIQRLDDLRTEINDLQSNIGTFTNAQINTAINDILSSLTVIENAVGHSNTHVEGIRNLMYMENIFLPQNYSLQGVIKLMELLSQYTDKLVVFADEYEEGETIPNEPYDPFIKYLSLDYCAKADETDIQLTHLYPFAQTQKAEDITLNPSLLPVFTHEGTLYIGLTNLTPGSNLNLLFQLAEATADSETNAAAIEWEYLRRNEWTELREGFHILSDGTDGLTRSGIVQVAVPPDINKDASNTIMPAGLHWIKAAAWNNTRAVSETIGIHTQAAAVTYRPSLENMRKEMLLKKGSISKLVEADSSLKGIDQPYESFNGQLAEVSNRYYQRVSERLRHKGRGIDKYDYERLVLDAFPEIYRVRCVNHAFSLSARNYRRDLELAPGFVGLAVIPDIQKLKTDARFAPQAPVSLLNKIRATIRKKISPFVRLKVMNPRYERVHIEGSVILKEGKPVTFFNNKLKEDLRLFMAPWAAGDQDALDFGRTISKSEVIRFVENLDYVDYICYLCLKHEETEKRCNNPDPVASTLDLMLQPSNPIICEGSPVQFGTGLPVGSQTNPVRYFIDPDIGNGFPIRDPEDPLDTVLNLPEDLPPGRSLRVGRYTIRLEEQTPASGAGFVLISTARLTVIKDEEVIVPHTARSILSGGEMRIKAERWRCPDYSKDPLCRGQLKRIPADCREPERKKPGEEAEGEQPLSPPAVS